MWKNNLVVRQWRKNGLRLNGSFRDRANIPPDAAPPREKQPVMKH
jgi:hypothetical protein